MKEGVEDALEPLVTTIFGRRKINPSRLCSDAVLELLDELKADLDARVRRYGCALQSEVIYAL